ncbi:MAG: hypothetical protein HYR55_07570 [Acidobacteria bacterium]|nr:hypothetical protein [Acidobacteriota bacterium]MBI3658282.1 hypothetical protein [Acidobacteriota bacterium]
MRRASSYNEQLSRRLQKPAYAQKLLLSMTEGPDALSLEEALRQIFGLMGTKEAAQLTGQPPSSISNFVKGKRTLKPETLNTVLKPFRLRTKIILEKAS